VPGPVFLTGGSGFIGSALLHRLIEDGREVRALSRSNAAATAVQTAGARPISGDLFDERALLEGMRGADTVFHVAGVNAMCGRDAAPMLRINVEGSAAVIRAAAGANIARVVYTSSAATIGEPRGIVGREDTTHRGGFLSEYEHSKFLAEERVLALGVELGVHVVSVNPSSVQGPGRTQGSARLLLGLLNARLPVVVDTFLSVVDIDDCVVGHLLAEEHGRPGERYLLNGSTLTTRQAIALVRSIASRPRRVVRLPSTGVSLAGTLAGWISRVGHRDLPFCPELARTLLHGHRYDGSRASRELGLTYRPIEETVVRTLTWYAEHGSIRPLAGGGRVP
jgi:dihydroflavonol-4-reductase